MSFDPITNSTAENDWPSWARVVITTLDKYGGQIDRLFSSIDSGKNDTRAEIEALRERVRRDIDQARSEFLEAVTHQSQSFAVALSKQGMEWMDRLALYKDSAATHLISHTVAIAELKKELQLKAGIWGVIGGAIPVVVMLAIKLLERKAT